MRRTGPSTLFRPVPYTIPASCHVPSGQEGVVAVCRFYQVPKRVLEQLTASAATTTTDDAGAAFSGALVPAVFGPWHQPQIIGAYLTNRAICSQQKVMRRTATVTWRMRVLIRLICSEKTAPQKPRRQTDRLRQVRSSWRLPMPERGFLTEYTRGVLQR